MNPVTPRFWCVLLGILLAAHAGPTLQKHLSQQQVTPAPQGPFHVAGNRLIDSLGAPFLIRGTELPPFRSHRDVAAAYAPHSATVLSTIRQRWNMNAVRLPLSISDYQTNPHYLPSAAQIVRTANSLELLVILTAPDTSPQDQLRFWRDTAALFRTYPNLIFQVDDPALIPAIRDAGAQQPIATTQPTADDNSLRLLSPNLRPNGRDTEWSALAESVPVLANTLDPDFASDTGACPLFPSEPTAAEALLQANLAYFDNHQISWIASEFRPGKLITDYLHMYPSSLENGWTCGRPDTRQPGIGEVIQFHLWGGELRGLFAVNTAGSFVLPRNGIAIIYGGIFAGRDARSPRVPASELAGIHVDITDAQGVTRKAGLLYAGAGWSQANVVVPPGCAPGPARLTVARRDGSTESTPVVIADIAPGFWTARLDGRGPVFGSLTDGSPISRCDAKGCVTLPIPVPSTVRLMASGLRYASKLSDIEVTIAGVRVPVIAYGPDSEAGRDAVTIQIPVRLRGMGEVDLLCKVAGRLSNVVRIAVGQPRRPETGVTGLPIASVAGVDKSGGLSHIVQPPSGIRLCLVCWGKGEMAKLQGQVGDPGFGPLRLPHALTPSTASSYRWDLPPGFPIPRVPPGNPMSESKVQLGRRLFYDTRLSVNGQMSCATCHRQDAAFADSRGKPSGTTGQQLPRSSMSLVNVAYNTVLTWNRPQLHSLEEQALIPMLSEHPVELGLAGRSSAFLTDLRTDAIYQHLFADAFSSEPNAFTVGNVARAIAAFERSIISARSAYDRYRTQGDQSAISDSAKRGEVIFFTDSLGACYRCHGGFNFSDASDPAAATPFHNNGLYNPYPPPNPGIIEFTRRPADSGKFKAPTLRNIALTAPYMHDGSLATLEAVVDHYASGGRNHPNQDPRIHKLSLTPQNRDDLVAFLRSLTDDPLTRDPRFSDPWR